MGVWRSRAKKPLFENGCEDAVPEKGNHEGHEEHEEEKNTKKKRR